PEGRRQFPCTSGQPRKTHPSFLAGWTGHRPAWRRTPVPEDAGGVLLVHAGNCKRRSIPRSAVLPPAFRPPARCELDRDELPLKAREIFASDPRDRSTAGEVRQAKRNCPSSAEALPARATGGGVGVLDLEPAVLERVNIVQFAAGDIERALGIHDHPDAGRFDQDVAVRRGVLQVHLVLQSGTPSAHHGHAEHPIGPPLFRKQGADLLRGAGSHFDQAFVSNPETRRGGGLTGSGGNHAGGILTPAAKARKRGLETLLLIYMITRAVGP